MTVVICPDHSPWVGNSHRSRGSLDWNDGPADFTALSAEAECEAISRRTKEALAVAKARGVRLGNPNGAAALRRAGKGAVALRAAVVANADRHAEDLRVVVEDIRAHGTVSLRAIARALNAQGIMTRRGGQWQVSNVRNLLGRLDCTTQLQPDNTPMPFWCQKREMSHFRRMQTLQKFASGHTSVFNHFNKERSLSPRANFKLNRDAAVAEWREICMA